MARVEFEPALNTVTVVGELDIVSADRLASAVVEALGVVEQQLELDLAGVTFMDSTGLAALLGARRVADTAQIGLRIVAASPAVVRTIDQTGLRPHLLAD